MGIPLDNLKISKSNWEYSELLRDALTCLAWGIPDVEILWAMSQQKRAFMTEAVIVKSQMHSYEERLSSEAATKEYNKAKT